MEIGNRENRSGAMSQINVTPFVDVMLVSDNFHGRRPDDAEGFR
jgi:hypothetical protein